jgi:hypothetical protein
MKYNKSMRILHCFLLITLLLPGICSAIDEMTVYDLLGPETHKFAIRYDTATATPGATVFFNIIRPGSVATDERALDRATGKELPFVLTDAKEARKNGEADDTIPNDTKYIKITLPRPVPATGESRLRIYKTYEDAKSYYVDGTTIVFERSLGVHRNVIVLPSGYELVSSSVPVMVNTQDGRIHVSMFNDRDDELGVKLVGRKLPEKKE